MTAVTVAIAAVTFEMRQPWNCPYCSHTSTRTWNLKVHIDRIHKGEFNPLVKPKNVSFLGIKITPGPPKSITPDFKTKDSFEWSVEFKNLLQQIEALSYFELITLMNAIANKLNR